MVQRVDIGTIAAAIRGRRIRITEHADEAATEDRLTQDEIWHSVLHGEIIEEYPEDKPYPSCLVMGRTSAGEPVHSVWAFNQVNHWAVEVTVYRPDPTRWVDWRKRR